jgi:DNA polymerase/3'-5' exonuclease PolX
MDLNTGKRYARKIADWLQPFCDRLEIVGSIRRSRPTVNDVDIVCIPIVTEKKDLLTFATRMLCRTGSKEHNIWLAQRAQDRGGHWNPYEGLKLHGKLVKAEIEEDIYRALGVPWIEPKNREIDWITRNANEYEG